MRKVITSIISFLILSLGVAMAFSGTDKKDDKKDKDKDKDKHEPIVIIIYLPAWSPVIREASLQSFVEIDIPNVDNTTAL